jgi:hypothetical protein
MTITFMGLISFLIMLALLVGLCLAARWFIGYMGVPHPVSMILTIIVGLICLAAMLSQLGLISGGPVFRLG